jgi:Uma2 family endonuclease
MALPKHIMTSVEEYLKIDEDSYEARYEYIDGDVRMLAGGTNNHAMISVNISSILHQVLVEQPCITYSSDARVQLSPSRYVYPDITISCDEREQGNDKTLLYPRLIVEVLSPGTEAYDRGNKLRYYRECPTIQEYMLVDSQQPFIEVFKRQENNFWTYHAFESGDIVELACLDVRFPASEVYRKVKFPDTRTTAGQPDQRDI